jgi:hypothetical protein
VTRALCALWEIAVGRQSALHSLDRSDHRAKRHKTEAISNRGEDQRRERERTNIKLLASCCYAQGIELSHGQRDQSREGKGCQLRSKSVPDLDERDRPPDSSPALGVVADLAELIPPERRGEHCEVQAKNGRFKAGREEHDKNTWATAS